jgi:hypothetical protein
MTTQLQGVGGTVNEVETNTRAQRSVLRPNDVGAQGSYSASVVSGTMAAGLGGAAPILAFLWKPAVVLTSLALIRRIKFTANVLGTGFTAGTVKFDFLIARAFTVQDTGGAAVTLTTNNAKARTSFATTQAAIQASATATLTAGTRTLDANPFRTLLNGVGTGTFISIVGDTEVYRAVPGDWPLVFAGTGEGFVIQATVPATGTWNWACSIDWDEVSSYGAATMT